MALLRQTVGDKLVHDAWACAMRTPNFSGRPCPICAKEMLLVDVIASGRTHAMNLCRPCEFIWFNRNEFESLPSTTNAKQLPKEVRVALALWDAAIKSEPSRPEGSLEELGQKDLPPK